MNFAIDTWRARVRAAVAGVLLYCLMLPVANAALITYTVSALGANHYRYDYTLTTQAGEAALGEFSLYFDAGQFAAIAVSAAPPGWDPLVLQADADIPADGIADFLAVGGPLMAGMSLAGFSATFDFLGAGLPGSQRFDIVDPDTFELLGSGITTLADPANIPEPGSLALLVLASMVLAVGRKRPAPG